MDAMELYNACAEWNRLTDPSVPLTDREHEERRQGAREIITKLNRAGMMRGTHYRETENGRLLPIA